MTEAPAVLPRNSNALVGTLDERIRAFDQVAANIATLQLNGWDTVQKAKAACWLADASGTHPATFMQNHYCMIMPPHNKLVIEPRVEFVLASLQSRVPGFTWGVEIDTDDCQKVWMEAPGRGRHEYEYTVADAKRQGLFNRANAWTGGNTREMCYKQAVKRCGRRFAADALLDMPVGVDGIELNEGSEREPSTADVIDKQIETVLREAEGENAPLLDEMYPATAGSNGGGDKAGSQPATDTRESAPPSSSQPAGKDPREVVGEQIAAIYGKLSKGEALKKAAQIYNALQKETTGVDPQRVFKSVRDIGTVEADQMITYLRQKYGEKPTPGSRPVAPAAATTASGAPLAVVHGGAATESPLAGDDGPEEEQEDDDAPPDAEGGGDTETVSDEEAAKSSAFQRLLVTVERARKLFTDRRFVSESPPGSGTLWLIDHPTFSAAGLATSVKLKKGDAILPPVDRLDQLCTILVGICDERERGGR